MIIVGCFVLYNTMQNGLANSCNVSRVGEAILPLLKIEIAKNLKKLARYTLEHPEHKSKEFGFPTFSHKVAS